MKLRGAWRRDYSEFFDTQEALLIDAMDNADSIYTVFARLQSLAVKCGCAGKLLLHESVPYTDEMLAAVTKKTVPAFRQCMQPLVQLGLVICEDGIYAIADWEFNQNVPAIDAMREGNRVRKASERARKNGKGTRQVKKDKVLAYLTEHPEATNTEVAENPDDAAEEAEEEEACLLPACKRTFHRHQHLVFPCILGIHLPNSFLFLRKTGARCLRPCSGTVPCRNLTILRALWHNLFRDAVK